MVMSYIVKINSESYAPNWYYNAYNDIWLKAYCVQYRYSGPEELWNHYYEYKMISPKSSATIDFSFKLEFPDEQAYTMFILRWS